MTTPTDQPVTVAYPTIYGGVWLETPDPVPSFVRMDAITKVAGVATELAGEVVVHHDAGVVTQVASIRLAASGPSLTATERAAVIRTATATATRMVATTLARYLGPTIDFPLSDEAGAPGGGA